MESIKAIKGTYDILPDEVVYWQRVEAVVRETMGVYGYSEIRTPIFENTGLFARSIGEDTDIVGKEMYSFTDMGSRSLTLRPEGTASVVRAFIEHHLDQKGLPQKLWYQGAMFRQERPQKGRQRQFHQFGLEAVGSDSPLIDVEVMKLFDDIAAKLGLDDRVYSINCLGGDESRGAFRKALTAFLDTVEDRLCDDCRRRKSTNPLRVLDCKVPSCREVLDDNPALPKTIDHLTEEDTSHFEQVKAGLYRLGVAYEVDVSLVRGLDYYTGTVFEMKYTGLGAQSAIMGGGRYDRLVGQLGGPNLPAVGFACGIERLILALKTVETNPPADGRVEVFIVNPDLTLEDKALAYVHALREIGISADMDYLARSMKAQMKAAAKSGAGNVVIIESEDGLVSVKNMATSDQQTMQFEIFLKTFEKELI